VQEIASLEEEESEYAKMGAIILTALFALITAWITFRNAKRHKSSSAGGV
jgi:hypothetical protein